MTFFVLKFWEGKCNVYFCLNKKKKIGQDSSKKNFNKLKKKKKKDFSKNEE